MEGSVPQKNKQDNEQTAETRSDFSATPTSSSSGSGSDPASRDNTPRSMPKFRYDKEELMKMRDMPLSKRRPACLAPIHDNADGHWDPEIWFRSFDNSRGNSPLTTIGLRERKRPADLDKDSVYKRKTADPKARVREEEAEGIVLSPQRRSFGTGCHVSVNPPRRPTSPNDVERESQATTRDHRKNGKIGSGRIQINHDRHEREYHDARGRYERDRDEHRTYERTNALDRYRRDDRDNRMRERDKERNVERERPYRREYERDSRYREGRNNRYYNRYPEEEPEWFTGGPSSQSETIELHGFDGPNKESGDGNKKSAAKKENNNKQREETRTDNHENSVSEQEEERKENKEQSNTERPGSRAGSLSIADRNGSLETNESSSPENSPQHAQQDDPPQASVGAQDFDFNVFFKTENIPGLMDAVPVEQDVPTSGSRFSQWFHGGSHHSSHTNSRRSSINDEFGYLNDLLNLSSGQKSPVIPSPPMLDPHATYYSMQEVKRASPEQQQTLLEMLHNANHGGGRIPDDLVIHNTKPEMPEKALTASDLEANLKALLMGGGSIGSNKHDAVAQKMYIPATQPLAPVKSKVLTAAELEAALFGGDRKQTAQHIENDKKLPDRGFGPSGVLSSAPDHLHTSLPSAVMSSAGKVKTVSELEAGLKQLGFGKDMQIPVTMTAGNKQLNMESFLGTKEHTHNDVSTGQASGDMNAFNKLLGMMKASGALPEPPRMPKKQDGRSMSPINLLSQSDVVVQHHKDVIQKLIQQQQQQTKILQLQQQVKLQQVKMQQQQQQQQAKQQLPQQKQQQDQILKFMKQNPGLIPKPAANTSPISPSLNLLPPASPRCPSPAIPQQALLQPSPSPRAPSPIMFGSQPPMHLTAPSPIHPSQLQQSSQTLSPNTLQVGQGNGVQVMQRVPSPQELIVHTQAIMQNALLKKQLEGQKERFLKKQQDRAKSPNPLSASAVNSTSSPSVTSPATSTPVSTKQLNPIFTPTSVIRKMVSEKVEKQQEAGEQGSPEKKMPILRVMHSDSLEDGKNSDDNTSLGQNEYFGHKVDTPPIMTVASDGSISIPVPVTPAASTAVNTSIANEKSTKDSQDGLSLDSCVSLAQTMTSAQLNQNMMQGSIGGNPTTSQPASTQSPSVHHIAASTASQGSPSHAKQPRAVMGSGMMNTQQLSQSRSQAVPQSVVQVHSQSIAQALNVPPGRPIVKGAAQMNVMTSSSQQRPVTGGNDLQQKLDNLITSRPIFGSQHNAQSQSQKTAQQLASRSAGPTVNPSLACTAAAQFGASVAGCVPLQTGLVRPGTVGISPPTSNPILMQRMVHPSVTIPTTARGLSPRMINQLSPLNALQTAQHRSLDPRFQTGRNIYPNAVPSLMAANTNPRGTFPVNAISRALSPQPQIGPPIASFTKHDGLTGPISPGLVQHSGLNANFNALLGAQGAIDNNLAKWFGTDVLKQQNSPMPPLPGQGQKVMTVDEIERRQQMVTN